MPFHHVFRKRISPTTTSLLAAAILLLLAPGYASAEHWALIHMFSGHTAYVSSVAFSPDGNKVLMRSHKNSSEPLANGIHSAIHIKGGLCK